MERRFIESSASSKLMPFCKGKDFPLLSYRMVVVAIFLVIFSGCSKIKGEKERVLAYVNGSAITADDFISRFNSLPEEARRRAGSTVDGKKGLLEEMIVEEMLYQEGLKEGLDKDEGVRDEIKALERDLTVHSLIDKKNSEFAEASDKSEDKQKTLFREWEGSLRKSATIKFNSPSVERAKSYIKGTSTQKKWPVDDEIDDTKGIIEVNGEVIRLGDFVREVKKVIPRPGHGISDPDKFLKMIFDNLIVREIFYQEAKKDKDIVNDPLLIDIKEQRARELVVKTLIEERLQKLSSTLNITDEDIRNYYENNKDIFNDEMVRVSHILVGNEEKAKEVMKKIHGGDDFVELAKRYSIAPSASRGGKSEIYLRKSLAAYTLDKGVRDAVFSLDKPGDITKIIKADKKYHIFKLEERHPLKALPFNKDLKVMIQERLLKERQAELLQGWLKDLRSVSKISYSKNLNMLLTHIAF